MIDDAEWTNMAERVLTLMEQQGVPRRDVVGVAHASVIVHVLRTCTSEEVVTFRKWLMAQPREPVANREQGQLARLLPRVTSRTRALISAMWDQLEWRGYSEDAAFTELWRVFDAAAIVRAANHALTPSP
jgi:hypothetical protein